MKIISTVNFVRGGKSSIARLLAEKLGTTILNFDPKRDSEFYNAIKTTNIPESSKITRTDKGLSVETDEEFMTLSSKSNKFVCDFGGRFDERINEFPSDIYIVPMMDDFESISESIRATKFILNSNPQAKVIHVLNLAMCSGKEDKKDFIDGYTALISMNKLHDIKYLVMPKSKLIKKLVNDKTKRTDIIGNSAFLEKGAYKNIIGFVDDLVNEIELIEQASINQKKGLK